MDRGPEERNSVLSVACAAVLDQQENDLESLFIDDEAGVPVAF